MRVAGLDLSLTGTGYATIANPDQTVPQWWSQTITSVGHNADTAQVTHARIGRIRRKVVDLLFQDQPDLVVVEGPSLASKGGHAHDRSGLWWLIYDTVTSEDMGLTVAIVAPRSRAKYATGNGNASKDTVLAAAIRRYKDAPIHNNNEADAIVLAAMGCRHLGHAVESSLPATHLLAMKAGEWPLVPERTAHV